MNSNWYKLNDESKIDSPSLLVYKDRIQHNIDLVIQIAGQPQRLRPHVKTHKSSEVAKMHLERGIASFKCATIAEAEMLAEAGAEDILLAYQPVGPKQDRLIQLAQSYSNSQIGCLIDDNDTLMALIRKVEAAQAHLHLWIDINNGMNRTGIPPGPAVLNLYKTISDHPQLTARGLHVYDGHHRETEFESRKEASDSGFEDVKTLLQHMEAAGLPIDSIVAGGSPTFPVHALREDVILSPGTYVYWDAGYGQKFPDMGFQHAAVLLTRVISKPSGNFVCLDLGHKAVGSENPLPNRVRFINADVTAYIGQSEEHLVVAVPNPDEVSVGDVWYGVPYHVCPTVALHQEVLAVEDGDISEAWTIHARDRRINI